MSKRHLVLYNYIVKRTPLRKKYNCKNCGKPSIYIQYPSSLKNGHRGVFCGRACNIKFSRKNSFNFNCAICGNTVFTTPSQMVYRKRRTCSQVCKSKLRRIEAEKRRIEFGYTKHQLDRLARYSSEAYSWRKAVFERDNYTCQLCGIRGSYIEADHIKPFAFFPELRYSLDNGRTLCKFCHNTTKIGYKKMRELYEKK